MGIKNKTAKHKPARPASAEPLETINGQFHILPIQMPPVPLVSKNDAGSLTTHKPLSTTPTSHVHYLYFKLHETRKKDSSLPQGRTLFVLNVPVDATVLHFSRLFRHCGAIENLKIQGDNSLLPSELQVMLQVMLRKDDDADADADADANDSEDDMDETQDEAERKTVILTADLVARLTRTTVHRTGASAYLVFESAEAAQKALQMRQRKRLWSAELDTEEHGEDDNDDGEERGAVPTPTPVGLQKWILEHKLRHPPIVELKEQVNEYLNLFDLEERRKQEELDAKLNQPDEDGFVTVSRRSKRGTATDAHGAKMSAAKLSDVQKLKPKKLGLDDFYRFQMRETKRNQLADLRRKFEEDKRKIEHFKSSRRFRPY
ncbi:ribosomal RNA-processing protein 7-domain-containing protein [Polychytrium aggregatum]|uniref:ribosomal RNA-processing protein 7-domain-containing protein n=1 Tax=Polychytrium aggregatum TaxID=110093 RepID=UPI0022FE745F|nr:ribosomal RNA-processing protein 7-domain-containing protein [Polychytrium aggregatum]KAI9199797.1 ribosomal RNA-processing protein 7-domain-containing protein [Polychytrium aggregatum]